MGPGYLRALRGPFGDVAFVPTGCIGIEDVPGWLAAGAAGVGLGSALVGGTPPRSDDELQGLTDRARRAVELTAGRRLVG